MTRTCPACQTAPPRVDAGAAIPHPAEPPPPAASIMPPEDEAFLRQANVEPPSRLGAIGRIGKFEIVQQLGQGGMANVYLATEPVTQTHVALKMLREEFRDQERIRKLFLAEAKHMYGLSHPGIMRVLEVSPPDAGAFFVMPYARGGSLDKHLGSDPLPLETTIRLATQIAEGLAYAHGKGLTHRDLKPANILIDEEGRAMIADFGLVRPFHGEGATQSGPEGTPAYMSPAVAAGRAEDTRADIYAFGALLYEMLAGHPPYTADDPMQVVRQVLDGPPPALATATRLSSPGLVAIATACMARELRDRYATMDDVLSDLKLVAAGRSPRGPHGAGGTGKKRLWFVATAVVVLLAGSVALLPAIKQTIAKTGYNGELARADALRAHGNWDKAAIAYAHILNVYPGQSRASFGLGLTEIARGNLPRGTQLLQEAHEADPGNPQIALALVENLVEVGHYEPAMRAVNMWLQNDPENQQARQWQNRIRDLLESSTAAPHAREWRRPVGPRPPRPHDMPRPPPGMPPRMP